MGGDVECKSRWRDFGQVRPSVAFAIWEAREEGRVGEMEVMKIFRREILIRSWQRRRLAAFESGCGGFGDRKRGFFRNT